MASLLFILSDRLSGLADKGEVTARYYNPGNVFDDVHLLTTSSDLVDPQRIAVTAGRARLHVHRLWAGDDRVHMALTPFLTPLWARRATGLARRHGVHVVRTGDRVTGYLGARIRQELGLPHILSLHADREDQLRRLAPGPRRGTATAGEAKADEGLLPAPRRTGLLSRWDRAFKSGLRAFNGMANRRRWANSRTGVLVGIVARKG